MSRTDQGIFKKILDRFSCINENYKELLDKYFPDNVWNSNYEFFSDFAYEANSLYIWMR